jgi:hypothetical protein
MHPEKLFILSTKSPVKNQALQEIKFDPVIFLNQLLAQRLEQHQQRVQRP